MKSLFGKRNLLVVAVIFVVAAYYYTTKTVEDSTNNSNRQVFVEVIAAKEQKIADEIRSLGTVKANESVVITSNVTEIISEIKFTDNSEVKKGEAIVILDASEEIAEKRAEELQLKEHERELKRLEKLVKNNAASTQLLDQRKTLIEISKQKIVAIDAKISDRLITAPFDGTLAIRDISKGALVKPGDIITTIDDLSKVKIDIWVPAIYLSQIKVGMPISATSEIYSNREFRGVISHIDSRVDEKTRSLKVRAIIDNDDRALKSGLLLNVKLFSNIREAILINEEAFIVKGDKHYLFIVDAENKVEQRIITIGKRYYGFVEVIDGLTAGEAVVTKGVLKIQDGAIVTILNQDEDNKNESENEVL